MKQGNQQQKGGAPQKSNEKKYGLVLFYVLGILTAFPIIFGFEFISPYLSVIMGVIVVLLFMLGLMGLLLTLYAGFILRKIFGIEKAELSTLGESSKALLDGALDIDKEEIKKQFAISSKIITFWLGKLIFRRWAIGIFYTLFISFASVMGAVLLYNQNDIISQQSVFLKEQSDFLKDQNNLMAKNFSYYIEKELKDESKIKLQRLSDQISQEIVSDYKKDNIRNLSPTLIGKIALFCSKVIPYAQMPILDSIKLSPEKGELLYILHLSQLDSSTYDKIYARASFSHADLQFMNFNKAYLKRVNLSYSNLSSADLSHSKASNANLSYSNLGNSNLSQSNFVNSDFKGADMNNLKARSSNFNESEFTLGGNWTNTNFSGSLIDGIVVYSSGEQKYNIHDQLRTKFRGADIKNATINLIPNSNLIEGIETGEIEESSDYYFRFRNSSKIKF